MKLKKLFSSLCAAVTASTVLAFGNSGWLNTVTADVRGTMRDMTTMELVRDMGLGINLGNTFESCGISFNMDGDSIIPASDWITQWGDGTPNAYETAWGSPTITEDMIKGYKNEGFGVLRVPVAWSNMMSTDGTYTISDAYLARVKQVVDWAINDGLYVILNIHWDGGWWTGFADSAKKAECMKKYTRVWEQLTNAFEDYGDKLMFEALNEEGKWDDLWNQWSNAGSKTDAYALLNEINQKFVDIVRSSDGNNPQRHLLVAGYGTDFDLTADSLFKVPDDPENRCAVSVHYYTPSPFCILEENADWAQMRSTWGTSQDFAELTRYMELMKTTFVDKGVPVIIGEYGATKKNKDADSVRLFLKSACKEAYERHLCPVLWDVAIENSGLHYDRYTCKMVDSELKAAFDEIRASGEEQKPAEQTETTTEPTTPEREVYLPGDVNLDSIVNAADAVMIAKHLTGSITLTKEQFAPSDLVHDEKINVFDLIALKRRLV